MPDRSAAQTRGLQSIDKTEGQARTSSARAYLVAATALVAATYGMCRFGFGLTLPRVTETLAVSAGIAGTASSLAFATYCICAILAGALVRRGRIGVSIVGAGVTGVVGSALIAMASGAPLLLIGAAIAGAAPGFVSPAIAAGLTQTAPEDKEPRWQAIANAGTGFGVLAAGIGAIWLPWRLSWIVYAVLTLVAATALLVQSWNGSRRRTERSDGTKQEIPGRVSALITPVVLALCMGGGSAVFWTFGRSQAESTANLSTLTSTLVWCAVGTAGIFGALSGDFITRIGFRATWALNSLLLGVAIAGSALTTNGVLFIVIGLIFGATYVVLCGAQISAAAIAWPSATGAGTAITFTAIAVGQVLGSAAAGSVIDAFGTSAAFILGGSVCVLGGLIALITSFGSQTSSAQNGKKQ